MELGCPRPASHRLCHCERAPCSSKPQCTLGDKDNKVLSHEVGSGNHWRETTIENLRNIAIIAHVDHGKRLPA